MNRRQVIEKAVAKSYGKSVEDMVDMIDLALDFADDVASELYAQSSKPNPLKDKLERGLNTKEIGQYIEKEPVLKVTDLSVVYDEYSKCFPSQFEMTPKGWKSKEPIPVLVFVTKNDNSNQFSGGYVGVRFTGVFDGDQKVILDEYILKGSQYYPWDELFEALKSRAMSELSVSDSPVTAKIPVKQSEAAGNVIGSF